ncbi:MBL fold metallo-hydrolase [Deltaproteobacteria bacterium OttesenSCG-928-M10]|nr:MBL fold metallo-hydrolase [Deltaproteobacteria bacterium OttesenSCG-928-M10]
MLEITSVIENYSGSPQLSAEHGLSIHIRQNGRSYLLDTGASNQFMDNAEKMGIDLDHLDGVVISHNHYDHTGGLPALLKRDKTVKVYIKSAAQSEFFSRAAFFKKNIGGKSLFKSQAGRFVFFDDDYEISDSIHLMSNKIKDDTYGCKDRSLLEKKDGLFVADRFDHELFMVVEENRRLVIISSCSHNGIVNIVNTVRRKYPAKPISHIIGGFHLARTGRRKNSPKLNCSEEYVKEIAKILKGSGAKIYTGHCTGKKAYGLMKEELGDDLEYFCAGGQIRIE